MASITFRAKRWQARVRRKGYPTETRTFSTKHDAERWVRSLETAIDRGIHSNTPSTSKITLGELIDRYRTEVTPTLKSAKCDFIRLKALARNTICRQEITSLTPYRIAQFRDERLNCVSSGTVIRELAYLSAIINHARKEWGLNLDNPVSRVRKPSPPPGRNRLLSDSEEMKLVEALHPTGRRSQWMLPLVQLALETGMRRGELLSLRWEDVNLISRTAMLQDTKNGERRIVPLSSKGIIVLQALPRSTTGKVFPITAFAASAAFERATSRAGISGLRFHDLRHTAITRLATKLPNVIELAAVSGHKSLRMLQRYYHPRAEDLARKLG